MKTENKQYKRNCPKCGKELIYAQKGKLNQSIRENRKCRSCVSKLHKHTEETKKKISESQQGEKNHMYGIRHSIEENIKNSNIQKERYLNPEVRKKTSEMTKLALNKPEIRKRHLIAMAETKYLGRKTDKGQLEFLEKWNRLGFNFIPNYQVHTDLDLFYIDGYDPIHQVVIEYDTKYHKRLGQREKDLVRQQKIIEILKPKKFWRYNSEDKQFKSIS